MTLQEAVNMLLRAVGSTPVNDPETTHPDVIGAKAAILRNLRSAQTRGWWFNKDENIEYYPDENRLIRIENNVDTILFENRALIKRGVRLYDRIKQTYQFDEPQLALLRVYNLDWDSVPTAFQDYVQYMAATEFVRDELEDTGKERKLEEQAARALAEVKRLDIAMMQHNIFNTSRVARARGRMRPYHTSRVRFSGDPDK